MPDTVRVMTLYPLADALDLELTVHGSAKIRGGCIKNIPFPELGSMLLETKPEVISSFTDLAGEDVGLIIHVAGDLHLFAFMGEYAQEIEVHVMKATKCNLELIFEHKGIISYDSASKYLTKLYVASFTRKRSGVKWTKINRGTECSQSGRGAIQSS